MKINENQLQNLSKPVEVYEYQSKSMQNSMNIKENQCKYVKIKELRPCGKKTLQTEFEATSFEIRYLDALMGPKVRHHTEGDTLFEPKAHHHTEGDVLSGPQARHHTEGNACFWPKMRHHTESDAPLGPKALHHTEGDPL